MRVGGEGNSEKDSETRETWGHVMTKCNVGGAVEIKCDVVFWVGPGNRKGTFD